MSELLTPPQAAKALGIGLKTLRSLYRGGELPVVRIGGSVRIDPSDLEQFIDRNRSGGVTTAD